LAVGRGECAIVVDPSVNYRSTATMTTLTTRIADYSSIATWLRSHRARWTWARLQYAHEARCMVAAGGRPSVSVAVRGIDGLCVRLEVHGVPGAIGHARTRHRARDIARSHVAASLGLDRYAFDLQIEGA
jgi:hypothetical protein